MNKQSVGNIFKIPSKSFIIKKFGLNCFFKTKLEQSAYMRGLSNFCFETFIRCTTLNLYRELQRT